VAGEGLYVGDFVPVEVLQRQDYDLVGEATATEDRVRPTGPPGALPIIATR
jgi:hypothetical protein